MRNILEGADLPATDPQDPVIDFNDAASLSPSTEDLRLDAPDWGPPEEVEEPEPDPEPAPAAPSPAPAAPQDDRRFEAIEGTLRMVAEQNERLSQALAQANAPREEPPAQPEPPQINAEDLLDDPQNVLRAIESREKYLNEVWENRLQQALGPLSQHAEHIASVLPGVTAMTQANAWDRAKARLVEQGYQSDQVDELYQDVYRTVTQGRHPNEAGRYLTDPGAMYNAAVVVANSRGASANQRTPPEPPRGTRRPGEGTPKTGKTAAIRAMEKILDHPFSKKAIQQHHEEMRTGRVR